jgi:hypothetical protein
MADKPVNFAPIDRQAADRKEATPLDLEAHARLEAGLVDSFSASDPVSASQPVATIAPGGHPASLWQMIKRFFR